MTFTDEAEHASEPRRDQSPRFGVWAPVYGTWGAFEHPDESSDASYERTRRLVLRAEEVGFDSVLLAEHIINPSRPGHDILETWTAAAALAASTERIEIMAAAKPLLFHPGVLAKQAIAIDHISNGRFAINLVSAWFRPEMLQLGIEMPPHDERYRYSTEWLQIVQGLWRGSTIDHHGPHFRIDGLALRPRPVRPGGPRVYFGGESEPARHLAAAAADVFFINGRPLDQTEALIADLRARPRGLPDPLGFGLSAFVIARESDEQAADELAKLLDLSSRDDRSAVFKGVDPEAAMFKVNVDQPRVGTNGGTLAGLVGSYDTVAERIADFHRAGIELFMLQFQPLETELDRFAAEIIPRVRSHKPALA